ncbi:MAG: alpha/beta fold hydrolase [Bdellovibrionales bacterium]
MHSRWRNIFAYLIVGGTAWLAVLGSTAQARSEPTFLLVHGALLTSSVWSAVQSELQTLGHNVVTLDVPGRAQDGISPKAVTLDLATSKVCRVAALQHDPVILVGHSQGGALITHAVGKCPNSIVGLIFVAAVVPKSGTTAFQDLSPEDEEWFTQVAALDEENGIWRITSPERIGAAFMADVPRQAIARWIPTFVNEPSELGNGTILYDTKEWNKIPKVYIETRQDRIIGLPTQRRIQVTHHFDAVFSIDASHSPFLSKPKELSKHIIDGLGIIQSKH